jgi:signal transduction histidine kinase/FixJ family two-component response regulator
LAKFKVIFSRYRPDELRKHFERTLATGENRRFEWVLLRSNIQNSIPCDISLVRFTHKGEHVVAAYLFDLRVLKEMLRERERVEIAEESSRTKSRFLARMSHEIRTPLTAVLGVAEIQLQNRQLPPHIEEAFAKIYDSANILIGIINDILDLSKVEAGKMSLISEPYETAGLISDITAMHAAYQGLKPITFEIEVDGSLPSALIGDALRIKQIAGNLLSNAFKYTETGKVAFSCFWSVSSLILSVKDTGMGMTAEQLNNLFKEYTRYHEKEDRYVSGIGLGMSIVDSFVKMMDAKITVESEIGKGTAVTVTIPQAVSRPEPLGAEAAAYLQRADLRSWHNSERRFTPEPMPYGKVLVVDDLDTNLYVTQGLLSFYGLRIDTAANGYEAIEAVKRGNEYDVIFMDSMMPGLTGTETMTILRGMGYDKPIVVLTAHAISGSVEKFLKSGFDAFVSKPIKTNELNEVLNRYVRDRQPESVLEAARRGEPTHGIAGFMSDAKVMGKLMRGFAEGQENTARALGEALGGGDMETARFLVHNLKSQAGMIGKDDLSQTAAEIEGQIAEGKAPDDNLVHLLNIQLQNALSQIDVPTAETAEAPEPIDAEGAAGVFGDLRVMLENRDIACLGLVERLKRISGTEKLIEHIEGYEFLEALETLGNR